MTVATVLIGFAVICVCAGGLLALLVCVSATFLDDGEPWDEDEDGDG